MSFWKEINLLIFEIWHSLLSPLFDIAEEYEQTMERKVKKMKEEGKKITKLPTCLI